MSKVPGFTLIELLIYLALLAWIAHLLFSLLGAFAHTQAVEGRTVTEQAQALMAFNMVVRDIRRASVREELWKMQGPHECIWHDEKSTKDIGWCREDDCLVRITGFYNKSEGCWKRKRRDRVVREVTSLQFSYLKKAGRRAVHCEMVFGDAEKQKSIQQWITIREVEG
jgi:type II secretory pathway component PulJ